MDRAERQSLFTFLRAGVVGAMVWLLVTSAVGQARVVPSGSMLPTIQIGDQLWTERISVHFLPVQRGEIVIFAPPFPSETEYIKRVIGLPGDTVAVYEGKVWVNGKQLMEDYTAESPTYHYGPVTVPDEHYLVLGDNRNHSFDSHMWGMVPASHITARAPLRIWPLDRAGLLR